MPNPSSRSGHRSRLMVVALAAVGLAAAPAWGYVDPGIVATLYQLGYLVTFGLLTALVLKPFRFLKSSLERLRVRFARNKQ